MEKEEKDIRFVARFYRENRLDTTQAWQKLGIGKQKNNSILLYRLITIAAVTFLIAGFSWWWIYDRQDWIVIASSAHAVKEVTLPDNSHITLAENSALQYDRLAYGKKNRNVTLNCILFIQFHFLLFTKRQLLFILLFPISEFRNIQSLIGFL